jgi:broad specificity phosphatase PhoE
MVFITFETHSTTIDNEARICSGHYDVELSELGVKQAKELGQRRAAEHFDAIFCSDMQRSYRTAELAFGDKFPIIQDARLRECDYGDLARHSADEVEPEKFNRISQAFPNGESYEQTTQRIGEFLKGLARNYEGTRVLIIGHGATRSGLEYWLKGKTINGSLAGHSWQPGWNYELHDITTSRFPLPPMA